MERREARKEKKRAKRALLRRVAKPNPKKMPRLGEIERLALCASRCHNTDNGAYEPR